MTSVAVKMGATIAPTLDEIASEWDRNVQSRAIELEGGLDQTYQRVLTPELNQLVKKFGSGKKVLDAGCGLGYLSAYLSGNGYRVVGIDISAESVKYARRRFTGPDFQESSITGFKQLHSGEFDTCVANMVFQNLVELEPNLHALYGLLSQHGILIASIPHPCFWLQTRRNGMDISFSYLETGYFKLHFKIHHGQVHPSPVTYIHRPISEYCRVLTQCGFRTVEFIEISDGEHKSDADALFCVCRKQ